MSRYYIDKYGGPYTRRLIDMPKYEDDKVRYDERGEFVNLLFHALEIVGKDGKPIEYRRAQFFKTALVFNNVVGYKKHGDIFAYVNPSGVDEYGFPKKITLFTATGKVIASDVPTLKDKPGGVYIIYGLPYFLTLFEMIDDAAEQLGDIDASIRQNLAANKHPWTVVLKDKEMLLSYQDAITQAQDGQPVQIVSPELGEALQGVEFKTEYLVDKLDEHRSIVRDRLLTKIGIMSANTDKRERVQVGEVNATVGQCFDYINMVVESVNAQFEFYGIPYKVINNTSTIDLYGENDAENAEPEQDGQEDGETGKEPQNDGKGVEE